MTDSENENVPGSPYWIGDEQAHEFARLGSAVMQAVHERRPHHPRPDAIDLKLLAVEDFEAYTEFRDGTATIHFSRGWIVHAYQALIGAAMNDDWPLVLSTISASDVAADSGKTLQEQQNLTRFLSSIDLAPIAFRFVYLHEYYHAALGHTKFLSDHFGPAAFATQPAATADEARETRKVRAAFELEADACAFQTLLAELFSGECDTLFARRGTGVIAIGFAVELMYLLNLDLTDGLALLEWGTLFRFDDPGIYTHPIKRRFYVLWKLFAACRDETVARAFEQGIEYGASIARRCYRRVAPTKNREAGPRGPQERDAEFTKRILELSSLMNTGQAMIDPSDWASHYDSLLRRVRPELSHATIPDPYRIEFALQDAAIAG